MITAFVFVMMLVIEYVNVLTTGEWQARLAHHRRWQYVLAAFLGATPGCLGAFAVAAMYSHGILSLGAVVAAMVATSGDESFMMLALIPKQTVFVIGLLFPIGIIAGIMTDIFAGRHRRRSPDKHYVFKVHDNGHCQCFSWGQLIRQWTRCSAARGILSVSVTVFVLALALGGTEAASWDWMRVTLMITSMAALFIVITVPDHFLEEHLWRHVALKHMPRIFLWTLGALLAMYILIEHLQVEGALHQGKWIVLLVACVVGVIPESGPHLIFVTLFAQGVIPLSTLVANSIVQDGHGMLPLLAESRTAFVRIKAVNLIVGLLVGATLMLLGL